MKPLAVLALALSALSLISCGLPFEEPPQAISTPALVFNLIFKYGVGAKNVLDTAHGTYTRDMIVDPAVTVKMRLSQEELDRILAQMDDIDFWKYPDVFLPELPPDGLRRHMTPYSTYYFTAKRGEVVKELRWDDESDDQGARATRLRDFIKLIRDIVESREEYKTLPQPSGGYM
jgi:hypothetical protein